jgi:hypothetical protein
MSEGLYELSLDVDTADSGHFALFLLDDTQHVELVSGAVTVISPGNHLLPTISSGGVFVEAGGGKPTVGTASEQWDERYSADERGCDPDWPHQHEHCAEHEECQLANV